MPEIGRPTTNQEQRYRQVTMAPKALNGEKQLSDKQKNEQIINKATGYKPKSELFKDGPHNQMGKDEFLKLLTFQLQNQDPMNPMEQSKITGELAQFSQLEQLTNLNSKFDSANKTQAMQDKFFAAGFVGKKVVTAGSTLDLKRDGDTGDVLFKLEGEAAKVMIRLMDEKNQTMGEIWKDGMSAGSHSVTWDGVALDGSPAVKGKYKVQIKAWDMTGAEVPATTQATGLVQSVTFDEGEPVLSVDGQKIYLRDVVSFHLSENETHRAINSAPGQLNAPTLQSNQVTPRHAAEVYKNQQAEGIYEQD